MSLQIILNFLADLSQNNNKNWFDTHRSRYQEARTIFEEWVGNIILALDPLLDLGTLAPKDCLFRINRDVRFSKDKSPYNTSMSASIGQGGRKGTGRAYYVQLTPNDSFLGAGIYQPDKTQLQNLRDHIADDDRPLRAILADPAFVQHVGTLRGEQLKLMPTGYDRQHPAGDLLRYKQFLAIHTWTNADLENPHLVQEIVAICTAMKPFLDYVEHASQTPLKPA